MNLLHLMTNYYIPQMLYVAAELGIADMLAGGPKTVGELAAATKSHGPSLERVLVGLATAGVFMRDEQGRWALTPLAMGLQSDVPNSQRPWVQLYGGIQWRAWTELIHSVRTGEPAFQRVFGSDYYEYLATHPQQAALMEATQTGTVDAWLADVARTIKLQAGQTIVDVGGNHGALLAQLLAAQPGTRGILFDTPHVVAGATAVLDRVDIAQRCTVVGGDMFQAVPPGGDTYLLSRVLLNWDDDHCAAILRNIRAAMRPDSTLYIVDAISPEGPLAEGAALWDVFLLVIFGARVRREADFRTLCEAAELHIVAQTPTTSQFSVLTIHPV